MRLAGAEAPGGAVVSQPGDRAGAVGGAGAEGDGGAETAGADEGVAEPRPGRR